MIEYLTHKNSKIWSVLLSLLNEKYKINIFNNSTYKYNNLISKNNNSTYNSSTFRN